MPIPDSHHGLLAQPLTALISTITPKGTVQTTALWFIFDPTESVIRFSITDSRKKYRNLTANPNATFFLLNPENPWNFIEVRGIVSLVPDPDKAFMRQIGAKHATDVSGYDRPTENRVVVTLTPTTVNAR